MRPLRRLTSTAAGTSRSVCATAVTVVLVMVLSAASASPRAACEVAEGRVRTGTWTSIPIPEFSPPLGEQGENIHVRHYAVDESSPGTMYVSDEWLVYETHDGGCSWEPSLDLAAALPGAEIVSLAGPRSPARPARAYVLANAPTGPVLATRATDAAEWEIGRATTDTGAPIAGQAARLQVAPSDPNVLYLTVSANDRRASQSEYDASLLYRSGDAGETWELRAGAAGGEPPLWWAGDTSCPGGQSLCAFVPAWDVAVDPRDPDTLWTANKSGIFTSGDGGLSWRNVYPVDYNVLSRVTAIDVFHERGAAPRVAVFGDFRIAWSDDGGKTWELRATPPGFFSDGAAARGSVDSVASIGTDSLVAARDANLSHGGMNVLALRGTRWIRVTPKSVDCPGERSAECLSQVSFSPTTNAFFSIAAKDAEEIMVLRVRGRP